MAHLSSNSRTRLKIEALPEGLLVKDLAIGTKTRTYMGMTMTMEMPVKTWRDAAGILSLDVTVLSKVAPSLVKNVEV